jgi:hypothetical protein
MYIEPIWTPVLMVASGLVLDLLWWIRRWNP